MQVQFDVLLYKFLERLLTEGSLVAIILAGFCLVLTATCIVIYRVMDSERQTWKELAFDLKDELLKTYSYL